MKKLILSALIAGAFVSSAAFAAPLTVNGGTVTFNGKLIAGACSIAPGDDKKVVELPAVKASVLDVAGKLANAKTDFTLELRDCDIDPDTGYQKVSVTFDGIRDATDGSLLANTAGPGLAQNVGLKLYGQTGALTLGTADTNKLTMVSGTNILRFAVDYQATGKATAGPVTSTADFQLNYE